MENMSSEQQLRLELVMMLGGLSLHELPYIEEYVRSGDPATSVHKLIEFNNKVYEEHKEEIENSPVQTIVRNWLKATEAHLLVRHLRDK